MAGPRPPKKSDMLEVRLPHAAKAAFTAHCRAGGTTASETVRTLIEAEVAGRGTTDRPARLWAHWAAAALIGLAVGGAAAPTFARSAPACAPAARVLPGR